jgi:two-component system, LytTR family, sensor kinase
VKKVFHYILTCLIVSVVLTPIMNKGIFQRPEEIFLTVLLSFVYSITGLYGSIWLFKYLDKKYDWLNDIWKRLIIGVIAVEFWGLFIYLIMTPALLYYLRRASFEEILSDVTTNIWYPLIMAPTGMLIIAAVEFFQHWKKSYVRQEQLKAEMMSYKYEALHNQLNPHFLFNSFNVLSSLVQESPDLAINFIDQLSDLYQRVLNNKDKGLIPLSDELDFIKSYIFLLKTRFDEKLDIQIDVEARQDEWIAPMVLQLLIENAVKHNSVSKSEPLLIMIRKNGDVIETRNKIRLKKVVHYSKATGLQNIQQRYSFFTDRSVEILESEGDFVVKIPVLKRDAA